MKRPVENRAHGFTTAELLISIFVGAAFILTGYQLYGIIAGNSSTTQQQAAASNLAYADLQVAAGQVSATCTVPSPNPSTAPVPSGTALPPGSTVSTTMSCPFGTTSSISEVTVTVNYGTSQVTHALYTTK
ncbi:MAG TPA: hypothetical protein VFQ70_04320 [Candidatus Saccharimonadaceae bacterium]|nr:hypothetical protein [Candidatus Saccharimonadaceae bacterium]